MSINKNIAVAAFAGLMGTALMTPVFAADQHGATTGKAEHSESTTEKNTCKGKSSCSAAKEKHACKGQNSCKGNSPDGKNECKGKSACATDGSK